MKKPKITGMTIELTPEEVLGLRHIHSHWAYSNGNAPFCDMASDGFLEKLGGHLKMDCNLWDHPIAKKWYDSHSSCEECQKFFPNDQLIDKAEYVKICQECNDIEEMRNDL